MRKKQLQTIKHRKESLRHYLVINMPYVLLHFLIKRNILGLWLDNTLKQNEHELIIAQSGVYSQFFLSNPIWHINSSFQWGASPEGVYYWSRVDDDYRKYLIEHGYE